MVCKWTYIRQTIAQYQEELWIGLFQMAFLCYVSKISTQTSQIWALDSVVSSHIRNSTKYNFFVAANYALNRLSIIIWVHCQYYPKRLGWKSNDWDR